MPSWFERARDIVNRLNTYGANTTPPPQTYQTVVIDTWPVPKEANNYITQDMFDAIEYDSQHLWALYLDGAPAPFDRWFPAQSVSEPSHGASVSTTSFGIEEVNMMNSYAAIQMRVETLDDEHSTLEKWLKNWQANCSDNYHGFKYPADICKTLTVYKYNWQKIRESATAYYVIPISDFDLQRNNEPAAKVLTVNFASFGFKKIA